MGDDVLSEHARGWERVIAEGELQWNPGALLTRQDEMRFLERFAAMMCLYSPVENSLFSRYSFQFPECGGDSVSYRIEGDGVFAGIPEAVVKDSGIRVMPGECVGGDGLYLKVPGRNRLAPSRTLPFMAGLKRILAGYRNEERLFLPVIHLDDIRDFESRLATVAIYYVDGQGLQNYDSGRLMRLAGTVQQKLHSLFEARIG
ncbi:hypothetical protein [Parendozoicomonas haliclonae]|nr:hypothetical protein [Parendozoicomonas haliclonae]